MTVHVQCNNCGAWGLTDNHGDPDAAVQCTTPEGDPPGSQDGTCCTAGGSHDEHAEYARTTGDANCRPLTITVMGSDHPAGPGQGVVLEGAS